MSAEARLVVGVDGGNSKTDLVLGTTEGEILARVRGEGTRSHHDGVPVMVDGIADLLDRARGLARVDSAAPLAVGAFFLANVDLAGDEVEVKAEIERRQLVERVRVRNDTLAVLRAGSPSGWGIAVVAGAGINAAGVLPSGREERFLALGPLTGDWGGGLSIAEIALGAAVRAGDRRGPATVLRDLLAPLLGCRTVEEVALRVARGELPITALHTLTPAVLTAAEDGDAVAASIRDRLVEEVGVMVLALMRRLDVLASPTPVVLGGGVLQRGPLGLVERIRRRVLAEAPQAEVAVLTTAPVTGALIEALELAEADSAAVARARAQTLGSEVVVP